MEKVILGGYFGFENLGDDAILLSEVSFLKENGFEPIVLTNKGKPIFGVKGISRTSIKDILRIRNEFSTFILGGGGLFQDKTSFRSLLYYLFLIDFMKSLKKKVVIFNVGVGPLIRKISIKLLFSTLKKADLVIFRDRFSFDFFPELKNKFLGFDSAFRLNFERKEKGKKILISLRYFKDLNLKKFSKFISILKEKIPYDFEFVVFSEEEKEIAKILNLPYFHMKDPISVLEKFSEAQFLIGARYHSIIFSIMNDVPFLPIPYDLKVRVLSKEVGFKDFIETHESLDVWIDKFNRVFEEREERRKIIIERKREFMERERSSFSLLLDFLSDGHI